MHTVVASTDLWFYLGYVLIGLVAFKTFDQLITTTGLFYNSKQPYLIWIIQIKRIDGHLPKEMQNRDKDRQLHNWDEVESVLT